MDLFNKNDNLNCGLPRQEYLEELEQAKRDAYNHDVKLSKGFCNWMNERFMNQSNERKEERKQLKNQMFPEERDVHPMDRAINEALRGERSSYYKQRQRAEENLFSDKEIKKRRSEIENNRHPMDELMRKQLKERENRRKNGF